MYIQNNISAINSNRNLNKNRSKLNKTLEKLSSGYQINRSADNAAGLAVSEKMRSLILGLDQAVKNSQDAVSLVQTAEGALQEVHSMLQRMKELSVQSANGEYNDGVDRASLQLEFEQIQDEIDHIANHSDFNGMMLFDGTGGMTRAELEAIRNSNSSVAAPTFDELIAEKGDKVKNIIYTETVYDFETTQTNAGSNNSFNAAQQAIANELQTSIVPQVVKSVTDTYTAFNYLSGSSIGIGLHLRTDMPSSTLAAVSLNTAYINDGSGNYTGAYLSYSLQVNVNTVDLSTEAGRNALEQTIAHEMIHAFMDEATTSGMTGITSSGVNANEKFPMWFIEGMAQTASGPGNWTRAGDLQLSESSTASEISDALGDSSSKLSSNSSTAQYGTGYLACMYLGYVAAGADADMSNSTNAAADIASGVSTVLSKLISGQSLNSVISEVTGGKYATVSAFENGFANDSDAVAFVQQLLQYTSDDPLGDGNVGGGLISGDLADTDPVPDDDITGINLFALNTSNTSVKNEYPSEVTILSGGTSSATGSAPVTNITPPPAITYPTGVFTVTGGTEGTDWEFDNATGTLKILTDADLEISGGTLTDPTGTYYGNIVIADGVDANITLSDINIDASQKTGNSAGIAVGKNGTSTITIKGNNTIKGGGNGAGIQLSDNAEADGESTVIINSESGSVLDVTGGTTGAGIGAAKGVSAQASNIVINGSGTINAASGTGAAAIGGSDGAHFGDITINGSGITIVAEAASHGAGIGGGWVANVGDITIVGQADITASGIEHGTGIGGGCQGDVGIITIGDGSTNDNDIVIVANGGNDGAAIGSSWYGESDSIVINGGTITANGGDDGAGIGSGLYGDAGKITINGGVITATGSTDASGIGSGKSGTIAEIEINGGEITADGGWTNDGGNIGGYADRAGKTKSKVTLTDPNGLSIKAGSGEGKYITTGTKDADGNSLYAFDMSYIDELLADGEVALTADGTDAASLSYPLEITVQTDDGTTYTWSDLQHMSENGAYIWMKGQDAKLTFVDSDGTSGSVDLKFFENYGMWRTKKSDLPPDPPKEPGYNNPVTPPVVTPDVNVPDGDNIWIMQTGPRTRNTFLMDIGRMNTTILGVDKDSVNISTQPEANKTIDVVENAIAKISMQRAELGAYQNRLEHKIDNLNVSYENLQAAESAIRDTDMAKYMMEFTKGQIISNAAQAMLAQAIDTPQGILSLLN